MSAQDARQRTRTYLATYIINANLTHDDDLTQASWISAFGLPDYPLSRVFKDKAVDVIFSIGTASAKAERDFRQYPYAYEEMVPIEIFAVDKTGITGTKLRWKAEAELRRITEAYPLANIRWVTRVGDNEKKLGSQTLYSVKYELGYIRPTGATETYPLRYDPMGLGGSGIGRVYNESDVGDLTILALLDSNVSVTKPDGDFSLIEASYTVVVA